MSMSKRRKTGILVSLLFAMLFSFISCAPADLAPSVPVVDAVSNGRTVYLSATATDPEGSDVTFEWELEENGDWQVLELTDGSYTFDSDGIRKLRVRAVDSEGNASEYREFTVDSANSAPLAPEVEVSYYVKSCGFTVTTSDPNGDEYTFEWEVFYEGLPDSGWHEVTPDEEGIITFEESGDVTVRVRAVDVLGSAGEWTEVHCKSLDPLKVAFAYPITGAYYPDGSARVYIILNTSGGDEEYLETYYWRNMGDTGDGEIFLPGQHAYSRDENGELITVDRGIVMEAGNHMIEILVKDRDSVISDWFPIRVHVNTFASYGFMRPCSFVVERPLFREAVEVRTECNVTEEEARRIRVTYGTPDNLIDNLGMIRGDEYAPVCAYMDDEKVLHIATTGAAIKIIRASRFINGLGDEGPWELEKMFADMQKLVKVDLSGFDLTDTTNAMSMFENCISLKTIIWPDMRYNNLRNISSMFSRCTSLETNPITFDLYMPLTINYLFENCTSLRSVDLSDWNLQLVNEMQCLFKGCTSLETVKLPNDLGEVKGVTMMFMDCRNLVDIDFGNLRLGKGVSETSYMFRNCLKLKEIDLDVNMEAIGGLGMFANCKSLETLDLRNVNLYADGSNDRMGYYSGGPYFIRMFAGCQNLVDGVEGTDVKKGLYLSDSLRESRLDGYDDSLPPEKQLRYVACKRNMFLGSGLSEAFQKEYANIGELRTTSSEKYVELLDENGNLEPYDMGKYQCMTETNYTKYEEKWKPYLINWI